MRAAIRLSIFSSSVVLLAAILSSPLAAQSLPAAAYPLPAGAVELRHLRPPVRAEIDLSGSYSGTVTPIGGQADNGVIVVRRENGLLHVTVGPNATERFRAEKVEQLGNILRFEFVPPDDVPRTIVFEMNVQNSAMSGTATMIRDGAEVSRARLELRKE